VWKPAVGGKHAEQAAVARSSAPAAAIAANHDPPMSHQMHDQILCPQVERRIGTQHDPAVRMTTDRASRPLPTVSCECGEGLTD
jgi:hypothetical protein